MTARLLRHHGGRGVRGAEGQPGAAPAALQGRPQHLHVSPAAVSVVTSEGGIGFTVESCSLVAVQLHSAAAKASISHQPSRPGPGSAGLRQNGMSYHHYKDKDPTSALRHTLSHCPQTSEAALQTPRTLVSELYIKYPLPHSTFMTLSTLISKI